jgi:hypothetical protein
MEGHTEHSSGQQSSEEMRTKCEMSEEREVTISRIISLIFVLLYPARNLLNTSLYRLSDLGFVFHEFNDARKLARF